MYAETSNFSVIMVQAVIPCLGCCHNLLTDFLLLHSFFLQSVLNTAREASCRPQIRSCEASAPSPRMALPTSEKPKSLQWLCTVSLLASLALSSPALSATTATQLDWPCSALNKPDSLPHPGPLTSCASAWTAPPTHLGGSLPHLQVSAPLPFSVRPFWPPYLNLQPHPFPTHHTHCPLSCFIFLHCTLTQFHLLV